VTLKPPPIEPKYVSLLWAGPERAADIALMHAGLFSPSWDTKSVMATLEHPGSTALVALVGQPKQLAGFVLGQIAADEAEILSVGVAPELQRRGIGRMLVEGLARAAKRADSRRLFLEVAADNGPACALYRGLGFEEIGRRKGYYQRMGKAPVDAINLALAL
jgi:ribosomal-protein-alanine N-acetyltransferase